LKDYILVEGIVGDKALESIRKLDVFKIAAANVRR
jgi:hypothetical protein